MKTMKRVAVFALTLCILFVSVPLTVFAEGRYTVSNIQSVTGQEIVEQARKWANSGVAYWSGYEPWLESVYWRTGYTYGGQTSFDCSGFVARVLNDCGFRSTNYTPGYGSCILSQTYGSGYIGISIEELINYGTDITAAVLKAKSGDYSELQIGDIIGWTSGSLGRHIIIYAGLKDGKPWMVEFTYLGYYDRAITAEYQSNFQFGARLVENSGENTVIKDTYPSYGRIRITKDNANIMDRPCSVKTDPEAKNIEEGVLGTYYTVTGLYLNTANNYWYQINTKSGEKGYIWSENCVFEDFLSDAEITDLDVPSRIDVGSRYYIKGTVSTKYTNILDLSFFVYDQSGTLRTGGTVNVSGKSYVLDNSNLDAMVEFNALPVGVYRCEIRARLENISASTCWDETVTLRTSEFVVGNENRPAGNYNAQTVVSLANQQVNGTWPNGLCLAYIATLFNQSYGFDGNVYSSCCAYQNGNRFIDSTSRNNIPLGACVYFGGSSVVCGCGNYAGHIGIYVGNNNIVHSWAGSIVCTSIDYVINCGYPYRGYGWYADQPLSTESAPVAAYDGLVAGEDGIYVHGWAFDPDTVGEYVGIQVYLNGEYWKTIVANSSRPDVHTAHGCGENHGFAFDIPITEAGTYSVHLYAVNTTAGAANRDMGAKEITITHTHSYTKKITKQANCTKTGVITYTCQGCQSAYTEDIPALGHNYTSQKVDATCTTQEHTKYTCTRCGDTYMEYLGAWSQWSTEYPTGVPEDRIEAKTQYSYRQKEYKTSNQNTLQGWTNYGTTYSDWSREKTTTTKPAESDNLRITKTTQTGWGYYHYCNYYSGCWNVDSIAYGSGNYYHSCVTNFEIPASYIADQGGRQSYGGTGSGAPACGYNFYYWFRNPSADVYTYTYQTREKINQFYRWSGWSSWSDEKVTSSEDREVKTRTVYRYKADGLADHSYSDSCDTACNICGATRKAEHIYIGDCSTKCKNCGATRTAVGKHTFAGGVVCQYCDATFGDVSATSWQIGPVAYAYDRDLMAGKGTDAQGRIKFDPNSPITREEFVQVLYNAEGKPTVSSTKDFPDVASGGWYKNAVLWAYENNIASGMGNGNFGVGMNITRQDLALMLMKYAALKGCSLNAEAGKIDQFADGNEVSDYAKNAMNWAVTNGILSGKGESGKPLSTFRLDPTGTATRAECAAMLKNFMTAFGL